MLVLSAASIENLLEVDVLISLDAFGVLAFASVACEAVGALPVAALAVGALPVGALVVGALAVGALVVAVV